jgi:branched-chain amino acid transport system substrate-binding protein
MSNTAPDLSTWKDGGYYFRTAPSDLLQGGVVGNQIVKDGNENVAIIYQQTAYGEGLEAKAKAVIEAAGATVVAAEAFPEGESNFDTIVDKVIAAGADSVLVVSYDEIKKIVPALQKKKFPGDKIYLVDGNLANFSDQAWKGYLKGAQGTLPGGETDASFKQRAADLYKANYGKELTEFAYLAESYDAVILLALAAEQAGIKAKKDIDFDGFSGPIEFDNNGDPTGASIGIWKYVDGAGVSTLQEVVAGNSVK